MRQDRAGAPKKGMRQSLLSSRVFPMLSQVSSSMTHGIPRGYDRKRALKAGVKRPSRGRERASERNVKFVVFDAQLAPSVAFCAVSNLRWPSFGVKKRAAVTH